MASVLDLRVEGNIPILVTKGISYNALTFNFENAIPPSDMQIVLTAYNNGFDSVFTVGSGLTISGNNMIWNLGLVTANKGRYKGKITTNTTTFGAALNFDIILTVA
jgi:hypothetical protein